jgi:hypothetical protein
MGASVVAYWPGITDEQFERQPGFTQDDRAWGNFMAEREDEPEVQRIMKELGAGALLTAKTDGWDDDEVDWVTPQDLYNAATLLGTAIREKKPGIERVLEVYNRNAHRDYPDDITVDLEDIKAIAEWAAQEGARVMTLEVNW